MRCSAAFRPEWQRWMHFGRERSGAFDVDSLATTRPIEYPMATPAQAEGMFDTLTNTKGSAVVRMLEQYRLIDRKSVVLGKKSYVRVDIECLCSIQKQKQ